MALKLRATPGLAQAALLGATAACHAAVDQPDRPISGSPRRRSASGSWREGWALEHARPVLDELDAAVEGAVVDHVERDVGIAVVDAFRASGTGDHGEHHDPEAIDDPGTQQRAGQADAAERAEDAGALLLHRPDRLHGVAAHEGRVVPREGRLERGREHHLRRSRELVDASLLLGPELGGSRRRLSAGEAGHQPVRVRAHQVRHRWLLAEPGEVLRPFETPPAGPAIPRRVAVQGGDEVDQEFSHRTPRAMDWSSDDVGVRM